MKRYYWFKLKTDFFDSDEIRLIEQQENGSRYIVFWLRLLLKAISAEDPGTLLFKPGLPYTADILAATTQTDIDTVRSAMKLFQQLGMLEIGEDSEIMIDVSGLVGSEGDSAERVRKLRSRRAEQAQIEDQTGDALQCNKNVTESKRKRERKRESREEKEGEGEGEENPPPFLRKIRDEGRAIYKKFDMSPILSELLEFEELYGEGTCYHIWSADYLPRKHAKLNFFATDFLELMNKREPDLQEEKRQQGAVRATRIVHETRARERQEIQAEMDSRDDSWGLDADYKLLFPREEADPEEERVRVEAAKKELEEFNGGIS